MRAGPADGERAAAEYASMMLRVAAEVVSLFRRRGLSTRAP